MYWVILLCSSFPPLQWRFQQNLGLKFPACLAQAISRKLEPPSMPSSSFTSVWAYALATFRWRANGRFEFRLLLLFLKGSSSVNKSNWFPGNGKPDFLRVFLPPESQIPPVWRPRILLAVFLVAMVRLQSIKRGITIEGREVVQAEEFCCWRRVIEYASPWLVLQELIISLLLKYSHLYHQLFFESGIIKATRAC